MKYLKTDKKIIYITILAFSFCLYFIKAPEEYRLNPLLLNFVYAISISIIAAFIFYVFNIYLPEQKRKNIIKHNFEEQYLYFKEKCIYIFLSALGKSSNAKQWEELCNLVEFKKYFKEKYSNDQDRWGKVYNELELNSLLLKDLLMQLDILRDEVSFVLNNIEINDKNVFSFFKLLSQSVYGYRLRDINLDYDEKKVLMSFLWQLFAGWSFADGYREEDIVKLMIEKM